MKVFNKPQYALAIKNNICSFVAFINDIPAFINKRGIAYNLSVPINHLVKNGKNTFKVIITPLKPDDHLVELSECIATVIVKDVMDNASDFLEISSSSFAAGTSNDKLRLPVFELLGIFEAKLPFNDYIWTEAPKLNENKQANTEKAIKLINRFHSALKDKDSSHIFTEITTREKELSQAFYEEFEKGLSATKKDFEQTFKDPNYVLQPLDYKSFLPVFLADGRMISFMNSRFEHPVFFLNDTEGYRREYPLYLCMNSQKELIIIR